MPDAARGQKRRGDMIDGAMLMIRLHSRLAALAILASCLVTFAPGGASAKAIGSVVFSGVPIPAPALQFTAPPMPEPGGPISEPTNWSASRRRPSAASRNGVNILGEQRAIDRAFPFFSIELAPIFHWRG